MAYCGTDWVVLGYFDGEFATPDQLQASALLWISNNNQQIRKYKSQSTNTEIQIAIKK